MTRTSETEPREDAPRITTRESGSAALLGSNSRWHAILRQINQRGLTPLIAVMIMVVVFYFIKPSAITFLTMSTLLDQSAVLLMLALSQGILVLMGRITLANAATSSFLSVILVQMLNALGAAAIPLVLVLGVVLGAAQGWIHTYFQLPSFVVTLAVLSIMTGASLVASGASAAILVHNRELVTWLYAAPGGFPLAFGVGAVITVVLAIVVAGSVWGRNLRAIGLNQRATTYSGVRSMAVVTIGFAVSGLLISLASIFSVAQLGTASTLISNSYLLPSIAAVVVGGTAISGGVGGPGRILFGVLIVSLLRVVLDIVGVPQEYQPIVYGVIIVATIAVTADRQRSVTIA